MRFILVFLLAFLFQHQALTQSIKALWSEIDSLEQKGFYRSALSKAEAAVAQARKADDGPAFIKSLLLQANMASYLEEDEMVEAVRIVRQAEAEEEGTTRALLQSILGEWYFSYFSLNYFRIQARTERIDPETEDFTDWSGDRLLKESNRLYLASVEEVEKSDAIVEWSLILDEGENADRLRPAVYDLLMDRAISHFRDSRSWLAEPATGFQVAEPAFAPINEFVSTSFADSDDPSQLARTLRLYQQWLSYLSREEDRMDALVDANLSRLDFALQHAWVDNKEALYTKALERLIKEFGDHPGAGEAWYRLARLLSQKGDRYKVEQKEGQRTAYQDAIRICSLVQRNYRGTYGAGQCRGLQASIERKNLELETEQVYLPGDQLLVRVGYRNVPRVWMRLIRLDENRSTTYRETPYWDRARWLSEQTPSWEMVHTLTGTEDYQPHSTEVALPPQRPGRFAVLISDNNAFTSERGALAYALFNVSEIGFLEHNSREAEPSMIVLNRRTGEPMSGVILEVYSTESGPSKEKKVGSFVSDVNGQVSANIQLRKAYRFLLRKGNDVLDTDLFLYRYGIYPPAPGSRRVLFFTDRSIYRPGQTVFFKGLMVDYDPKGVPKVVTDSKTEVQLLDANRQQIADLELQTNGYGTFQGSFVLPTTGVLGSMTLRARQGGTASIRVEEYKRPRFEVLLDTLDESYALGDEIRFTGEAMGYAGNPIDRAQVKVRVTRSAYFPWHRWGMGYFPQPRPAQQIAYLQTTTDQNGKFTFSFLASPDFELGPETHPAYIFRVEADVTDLAGETRTATQRIFLSEKRLVPELNADPQVEAGENLEISLGIRDLNGNPATGQAQLRLESLSGPGKPLVKRYWEVPDQPLLSPEEFASKFPGRPYRNEHEPANWPVQEQKYQQELSITGFQELELPTAQLGVGYYRLSILLLEKGANDTTRLIHHFYAYNASAGKLPAELETHPEIRVANRLSPQDRINVSVLANEGQQPVWMELTQRGKIRQSLWLKGSRTDWSYTIQEEDKGNLYLKLNWVRNNRQHQRLVPVAVPWMDKELNIEFETFRDKIKPGSEEEWHLKITGPEADPVQAEVLASMYDQSLDQFEMHDWETTLFPTYSLGRQWEAKLFGSKRSALDAQNWQPRATYPNRIYPHLLDTEYPGYGMGKNPERYRSAAAMPGVAEARTESVADSNLAESDAAPPPPPPSEDPSEEGPRDFVIRRDLRETAFFFPQLQADAKGGLDLKFEMGEALTRWKFMLFAHTPDLKYAFASREVVTQKELMVLPNAPRYFREGDRVTFSAKVVNLSEKAIEGEAILELENPFTGGDLAGAYDLANADQSFALAPGASAVLTWPIEVPESVLKATMYRVKARAGNFTDGEQAVLPVISNKTLITETLPIDLDPNETANLEWEELQKALSSKTIRPLGLTLQLTSNPSWLAVKSLPYLMEYPHACTEQLFNRYFANTIASYLANSDPKIRHIFEEWKRKGQLESPLSANAELKDVLLTETPWVRDAQSEKEQQERIALLFDLNRIATEQAEVMARLQDRQMSDGGFPWFPEGPSSWYITQYMLEGMGRLHRLAISRIYGDPEQSQMLDQMINYIDDRALEWYQKLEKRVSEGKTTWEEDHLSALQIHWIFTRSYFPAYNMDLDTRKVKDYLLGQIASHWAQKSLHLQAMGAMAAHRWGKLEVSTEVIASLKERSIRKAPYGIYWKQEAGWNWYQQDIETQSLILEFFSETNQESFWVNGMRVWLLKNKQVNRWETTKATASAVLALLKGNGATDLGNTELLDFSFPKAKRSDYKDKLEEAAQEAEAGVGYLKAQWQPEQVTEDFTRMKIKNPNPNIAWASLFWQYLENADSVDASASGPLKLKRELYVERVSEEGVVLEKITAESKLQVGEKLVLRIKVSAEQDMEFIHLKMQRAAGLEPIITESGYHYQAGLSYYESIRDAANHFFMEYLPRGTHVLEYPLRVAHAGDYSMGIGLVQSMYAPEFASRTEGVRLTVR